MVLDLSNQLTTAMVVFSLILIAVALMLIAFGKLEREAKKKK